MLAQLDKTRGALAIGLLLIAILGACTATGDKARTSTPSAQAATSASPLPAETEPTSRPPEPKDTPVSPTSTPQPPTVTPRRATATRELTEPAETPTPEPTVELSPIIPIGAVADFTASDDIAGIEGLAEVIEANRIRISNFVSLVAPAPGVDIRLGLSGDFSDEVSVVLRDITGNDYQDRTLTVAIPNSAFDGRTFDSIAVFCFATGEIFDWAMFE